MSGEIYHCNHPNWQGKSGARFVGFCLKQGGRCMRPPSLLRSSARLHGRPAGTESVVGTWTTGHADTGVTCIFSTVVNQSGDI